MTRLKLDGVIEAVRYTTGGQIDIVRVFERHGTVWSDHILLNRKELFQRLELGKHFIVGERKIFLGGVFNTGSAVHLFNGNIIIDGQTSGHDLLSGVPVF